MLKIVLNNRGLVINARKCLFEGVIVQTALYGAEAWGMISAEIRKVNVLEIVWEVWLECHEWMQLRMKRCVVELVQKFSWQVELIREY